MDAETKLQFEFLKQAQIEIKESVQHGTGKVEGKIDALALQFGDHRTEDAVNFKGLRDSAEQVRRELDRRERDTEKRKDNRWLVWVAVVGAVAAAVATFAVDSMRHSEISTKLEQIKMEVKAPKSP
jgi:hypothetical protein